MEFVASINGKAVCKGDLVYSAFHGRSDLVAGAWADEDRDVYIYFENIGQAKITSCVPVPSGKE